LFTLIESSENKQLKLYVYNVDLDTVREVLLTPNSAWGGEGSIGCGIGYGYLHRIPIKDEKEKKPLDVKTENTTNKQTNILTQNTVVMAGQSSVFNNVNNQLAFNVANLSLNSQPLVTPSSQPDLLVQQPPSPPQPKLQLQQPPQQQPQLFQQQQPQPFQQQQPQPLHQQQQQTTNLMAFDLSKTAKLPEPQVEQQVTSNVINLQSDQTLNQQLSSQIPSFPPQIQFPYLNNNASDTLNANPTTLPNFQFMNIPQYSLSGSQPPLQQPSPFTNYFQQPQTSTNTNPNQMVQSLVQGVISNHLLQQQQQQQPTIDPAFTFSSIYGQDQHHGHSHDGHGHSHDGHGHSHDSHGHGHSHGGQECHDH
jgi:hypothetical protein